MSLHGEDRWTVKSPEVRLRMWEWTEDGRRPTGKPWSVRTVWAAFRRVVFGFTDAVVVVMMKERMRVKKMKGSLVIFLGL